MRSIFDDTEDLTWQEYANCLGVDPDLFFPAPLRTGVKRWDDDTDVITSMSRRGVGELGEATAVRHRGAQR